MEIINVKVESGSLVARNVTKAVKISKTWKEFKKNLAAGKNERDFTGIGPYLEVEVKDDAGNNLTVKVPFFLASEKDKLVDAKKVNPANPLALQIMEEYYKTSCPKFDIEQYKTDEIKKIDDEIAALGATPDPDKLNELNAKKAKITALKKKNTQRILKEEIAELENGPDEIDLTGYRSNKQQVSAMLDFIRNKEKLIRYKENLKHLTWSEKTGFHKLNNKYFKRVVAIITALALGSSFVVVGIVKDVFGLWSKAKDSKPKNKIVTTVDDSEVLKTNGQNTSLVTAEPTAKIVATPTTTPTVKPTKEPTATPKSKYGVNDSEFESNVKVNMAKFNGLEAKFSKYKYYNYEECVKGYTFVEHLNKMDTSKISRQTLEKYVVGAKVLIAFAIAENPVCPDYINMRENNHQIVQDILDGKYHSGVNYILNASESNEPLIDMLTIGQLEMQYNPDASNFEKNIYLNEICEYEQKICNGDYIESELEAAKTKTIGSYPNV